MLHHACRCNDQRIIELTCYGLQVGGGLLKGSIFHFKYIPMRGLRIGFFLA